MECLFEVSYSPLVTFVLGSFHFGLQVKGMHVLTLPHEEKSVLMENKHVREKARLKLHLKIYFNKEVF